MQPYKLHDTVDCIPLEWRCKHQDKVMVVRPWLCWLCTADDAWVMYSNVNQAYRDGQPVMNDKRFDIFEQLLRDRWPNDKRFWKVGDTKCNPS